jgi:hypothetical protein
MQQDMAIWGTQQGPSYTGVHVVGDDISQNQQILNIGQRRTREIVHDT